MVYLPGRNQNKPFFNLFLFNELIYKIYVIGLKIFIINENEQVIQTLDLKNKEFDKIKDKDVDQLHSLNEIELDAMAFNPTNKKLALVYQNHIHFYLIKENFINTSLSLPCFEFIISYHLNKVSLIEWIGSDKLLVGGQGYLKLYELKDIHFNLIWEQSTSGEVKLASISPDEHMIAVVHEFDPLVKIWYLETSSAINQSQISIKNLTNFTYLKHPRKVINLNWYIPSLSNNNTLPTLMTSCDDGVFRVWQMTNYLDKNNHSIPFEFYLSLSIDSSEYIKPVQPLECSNNQSNHLHSSSDNSPFYIIDEATVNLWVKLELQRGSALKKEFNNSIVKNNSFEISTSKSNETSIETTILNKMFNERPLLLIQFRTHGELVVFQLEGLNLIHKEGSEKANGFGKLKALLISRLVLDFNFPEISYNLYYQLQPDSLILNDLNQPSNLLLYLINSFNEVTSYSLNLNDLLFNAFNGPLLKKEILSGLIDSPIKLTQCYKSIYQRFAILYKSGIVDIWQFHAGEFIRYGTIFGNWCDIDWLDEDHLLLLSSNEIKLFLINSNQIINLNYEYLNNYNYKKICSILQINNDQNNDHDIDSSIVNYSIILNIDDPIYNYIKLNVILDNFSINITSTSTYTLKESPIHFLSNLNQSTDLIGVFLIDNQITIIHYKEDQTNKLAQVEVPLDSIDWWYTWEDWIVLAGHLNGSIQCLVIGLSMALWGKLEIQNVQWPKNIILSPILNKAMFTHPSSTPKLALCTKDHIIIFHLDISHGIYWTPWLVREVPEDSKNADGLIWLSDGTLVLNKGRALFEITKWITNELLEPSQPINSLFPTIGNLDEKPGLMTHPLEPTTLIELIEFGQYDLVLSIIYHIEEMVSLQDNLDDEYEFVLPPLPLDKLIGHLEKNFNLEVKGSTKNVDWLDSKFEIGVQDPVRPMSDQRISALLKSFDESKFIELSKDQLSWAKIILQCFYKMTKLRNSLDHAGFYFLFKIELMYQLNKAELNHWIQIDYDQAHLVALYSHYQEQLVMYVRQLNEISNWEQFERLGLSVWLRDDDIFSKQMEELAKAQYLLNKDPSDCSLIYLALGKKKLLHALWRNATYHKDRDVMVKFLGNDFSLDRWKVAAQKNAFKLLGLRRFEYAAAFFLLGGCLKDAINVLIRQVQKPILAWAVCRCVEGSQGVTSVKLIKERLLPDALNQGKIALISYWLWWLQESQLSIRTLIEPIHKLNIESKVLSKVQIQDIEFSQKPWTLIHAIKNSADSKDKTNWYQLDEEAFRLTWIYNAERYYQLGKPILAILTLGSVQVEIPTDNSIEESTIEVIKQVKKDEIKNKSEESFDWGWEAPKPKNKKLSNDIFADEPNFYTNSALNDGTVEFDSWSFGTSSNFKNNTSSSSFLNKEIGFNSIQSLNNFNDKIKVNLIQYENLNLIMKKYNLLIVIEVIKALKILQNQHNLPNSLISSYLDKVKNGLLKLSKQLKISFNNIDEFLLEVTNLFELPLIGFDLLFQGLLNKNSTLLPIFNLKYQSKYLLKLNLNNNNNNLNSKLIINNLLNQFKSYSKWSITYLLEEQIINLKLLKFNTITFIGCLILNYLRLKLFNKIQFLLSYLNNIKLALQGDLHELQKMVKELIFNLELTNQNINEITSFDLEFTLKEETFDQLFEMDKNLKLKHKNNEIKDSAPIINDNELILKILSYLSLNLDELGYLPNFIKFIRWKLKLGLNKKTELYIILKPLLPAEDWKPNSTLELELGRKELIKFLNEAEA